MQTSDVKQESQDNHENQEKHREASSSASSAQNAPITWSAYIENQIRASIENWTDWQAQNWDGETRFRTPLFDFVRALRGQPALREKTAADALKFVEAHIQASGQDWESLCGGELTSDDAQTEVIDLWERVRNDPNVPVLQQAWKRGNQHKLLPKVTRTDVYQKFISFAGWLQVVMGNNNIMLPCEQLARPEFFNCSAMTITRLRQWAEKDGYIKTVKKHKVPRAGIKGEATEFRFDVKRFKCLQQTAQIGTDITFDSLREE